MSLCRICGNFKKQETGRKVSCRAKGFVNQRVNNCNAHIPMKNKKYDALAWTGVN